MIEWLVIAPIITVLYEQGKDILGLGQLPLASVAIYTIGGVLIALVER